MRNLTNKVYFIYIGDIMKKIDREYGTQDRKEVLYLIDNGIKYKFNK